MNYFELYNIPVSLQPDQGLVKQRFYALSRQFHPDFFGNASEDEQAVALETSSAVNKAYKIFTSPDETIKYLLEQKGLLQEEEKYQLPADFLMEMMELNEAAMEGDKEQTAARVSAIQNEIYEPIKDIMEGYSEGVTSTEELLQVKDYYYKKKYLNRILGGLG